MGGDSKQTADANKCMGPGTGTVTIGRIPEHLTMRTGAGVREIEVTAPKMVVGTVTYTDNTKEGTIQIHLVTRAYRGM